MNVLKNRVVCINKVRSYINEIAPQIISELEKGFSIKTSGYHELFKKDEERIKKVIESKDIFRAILRVSEYSIWLNVNAHYQTNYQSCAYYEESVYLWNIKPNYEAYRPEQRELVSLKQLQKAAKELPELIKKKDKIGSKISKHEILLNR